MSPREFDQAVWRKCAESIIAVGKVLHASGWTPATSSNFSMRMSDDACAITVSGKDKGRLSTRDVMVVDFDGVPQTDDKPSAETLLHTQLYQRDSSIGAVLHTHSPKATVLTRLWAQADRIALQDYELLKAFAGINTHATSVILPVFDNTQDIPALAHQVDSWMAVHGVGVGYLIRGHGLYTWGATMDDCFRHLEALEFLLDCEWQMASVPGSPQHVRG